MTISTRLSYRIAPVSRTRTTFCASSRRWPKTHDVLRMKGFVSVEGKPMRLLVQGVGARFEKSFDRAWAANEERQGRLVVIGEKGLDAEAIRDALAA